MLETLIPEVMDEVLYIVLRINLDIKLLSS